MNQLSLTCSLLPKNHIQKKIPIIIDYGSPINSDDRLSISFRLPITNINHGKVLKKGFSPGGLLGKKKKRGGGREREREMSLEFESDFHK